MSSKYGINIEFKNENVKDISISNNRTIAIIGDDDKEENKTLKYYPSINEALKVIGEGSIRDTLEDLQSVGIESTIITSGFAKDDKDSANDGAIKAIDALLLSSQTPKFILAPLYDNDKGVQERLKIIADKLGAVFVIEILATKEDEIKNAIKDFKSPRAIITYQKVQRLDKVVRPLGAFLIGSYAKIISSGEYGFAQSFSNRIIDGIVSIIDEVEFISGSDCVADRLRSEGVSLAISDDGLRAWGGEVRDSDFSSLHSVVIFDRIIESIRKSQKEAIDKQVSDVMKKVVDDLEAFYRKLVANNVAVGFEVSIPTDINTNQSISEGKIYIKHQIQEMPLLKNLTNRIYRVNSYGSELIKEL